jgi:hypothetical protein
MGEKGETPAATLGSQMRGKKQMFSVCTRRGYYRLVNRERAMRDDNVKWAVDELDRLDTEASVPSEVDVLNHEIDILKKRIVALENALHRIIAIASQCSP